MASVQEAERPPTPDVETKGGPVNKEDDDVALKVLHAYYDGEPVTESEKNKVRWKIDFFLLPLMIIVYALQFLDKVSFGLGSNFGVLEDLELETINEHGEADLYRFSNASMIFWVGFIVGLYPLTYIAQRLPCSKACAAFTIIWGGVFLCAPACKNYGGILAQRFFLGFMESGVSPAFMFLTAMFYTKAEQASRSAIWFSATGLSQLVGYPIMVGVLKINMSIPKWQAIYYLWGACTVVFGALFYFLVPDNQAGAWFLNEREKYVAVERLRENKAGLESKSFKRYQAIEAITDKRCITLMILAFLTVIPNGCVSTFSPIVLKGLGYSPLRVLVMTIPQGATSVVYINIVGFAQQKWKNIRAICFVIAILPIIVCSALLWKLPQDNNSGRLAAVTLFPTFTSAFITLLSFSVSNVSGHTKRGVANTMFLLGYAVGQVAAPLTYKTTEKPLFPSGFMATMICLCLSIAGMAIYIYFCIQENRRRDKLMETGVVEDLSFLDKTDKENLVSLIFSDAVLFEFERYLYVVQHVRCFDMNCDV